MTNNPRGLARIEQPHKKNFCWRLRIQRSRQVIVEYFTDRRYGSKQASLQAAMDRYQSLLADAPPALPVKNRMTSRNRSGKVGVRISYEPGRAEEKQYKSYVAFWVQPNGKSKAVQFSLRKYGERQAWGMACIARDHETSERAWIEQEYNRQKLARREERLQRANKKAQVSKSAPEAETAVSA